MPKGSRVTDLLEHFDSKLIVGHPDDHWSLDTYRDESGYHVISVGGGRKDRGHRVSYELFVGAIPRGFVVDHLCVTEWCCNPAHLEAVTHGDNIRRSYSICDHGHDLINPANYYQRSNGGRICKPCNDRRNAARGKA